MNNQEELKIELEFEREIARSRELSLFRRNPTTWELLLIIAQCENGSIDGVYRAVEAVSTHYLGNSALLKFVRDRRDDGLIQFLDNKKKSKRTLQLSEEVLAELRAILVKRNQRILAAASRPTANGLDPDAKKTTSSMSRTDTSKETRA